MVNTILATAGAALVPVAQQYLFQARQVQALSLAVQVRKGNNGGLGRD